MDDMARTALDTLVEVQHASDSAEDLSSFGVQAARILAEALEFGSVTIELFEDEKLVSCGAWGDQPGAAEFLVWREDVAPRLDAGADCHDTRFGKPTTYAYALPLLYGQRAVGAVFVTKHGALGDEALTVLGVLAGAIAKCCSLFSLQGQLNAQTAEFVTLIEIGKAINAQLNLAELLDLIAMTTLKLTQADTASVAVPCAGTLECELAAASGLRERTLREDGLGALGRIIEEIAESGMSVLAPDLSETESKSYALFAESCGARSLVAVPLRRQSEVLGVLVVEVTEGGHRFGYSDLDIVLAVADQAGIAMENARLYGDMQDLYVATIRSLAYTIEAKDKYTRGHSDRVTEYAVSIAQRMGFSADEVSTLRFAGILHDIGKIAVSEEILNKPGKLTDLEREIIQTHPAESARIIRPIGFLKDVVPIVEHHHEWFDGSGYGAGIAGDSIPRGARVLAVADSFEAMTSDRPYHAARPWTDAVAELKRCAGSQFDPAVVEVFVGMILESLDTDHQAS